VAFRRDVAPLPAGRGEARGAVWPGAAAVFSFVFFLEWQQLAIPGRIPDLTQALLALAGWLAPVLYLRLSGID
jgi:hypothetical protein